jgi:hypothetical protein
MVGRDYILQNGLQFDDFYVRLIFPEFHISLYEDEDLGVDSDGHKLLGRYSVQSNAAHLDQTISRESGDPRRIFTCWHEVAGHGVLQGGWLRQQLEKLGGEKFIDVTEQSLTPHAERILELQANLFAAHLAAPDWLINYAINTTFRPTRQFLFKEPCIYWLDVRGLSVRKYIVDASDLCGWIGSKISGFFGGLSAEAIGYRIADLRWVRDEAQMDLHLHRAVKARSANRLATA